MVRHMITRLLLASTLAAAAPALALQTPPTSQPGAHSGHEDIVRVALQTQKGRIVLALDKGRAPITTANFLHYVESGKLNGESFYRAMPFGNGGLLQGGITSDGRKLAKAIAHEAASQTGLSHVAGTVSMAATAPGKAQSDFFILTVNAPSFDQTFAPFGKVVEGMDVVQAMLDAPRSATRGEGVMKGQMLDPAIKIIKAERLRP
jgi:peptidyl-prolyl cis-trans isomerase A (cyclophilin A)